MENRQKIISIIGCVIVGLIGLVAVLVMGTNMILSDRKVNQVETEKHISNKNNLDENTNITDKTVTNNVKEDKVSISENTKIKDTQTIMQAKIQITNIISEHENKSALNWSKILVELSGNNKSEIQKYLDIAIKDEEELNEELERFEWGYTGNEDFDKKCKELQKEYILLNKEKLGVLKTIKNSMNDMTSLEKQMEMLKLIQEITQKQSNFYNKFLRF